MLTYLLASPNLLTHSLPFAHQVQRGVAYQATIEDDLLLEPGFARFVEALTARHALTE